MKKIYEAKGKNKKAIIEIGNDYRGHEKVVSGRDSIGIPDMVMVTRVQDFPFDGMVDSTWQLNGLLMSYNHDEQNIVIVEPFIEQVNNGVKTISPSETTFDGPIQLSSKAIMLVPLEMYESMQEEQKAQIDKLDEEKRNVRFYTGDEQFATMMLLYDRGFVYLDVDENGYPIGNHIDVADFAEALLEKEGRVLEQLQEDGRIAIYSKKRKFLRGNEQNGEEQGTNFRMISGLTKRTEGEAELDEGMYAATDIGKVRENQEDAVLLIRDKDNSKFKMAVVADGMGGWQHGEVASSIVINGLKDWFESLTPEQKECFHTGVEGLKKSLFEKIELGLEPEVVNQTWGAGGTTLVCAIVGEHDTLVANVGDSRACIAKNGEIRQLSREDTVAQKHLEEGKTPSKEAARFDNRSNEILQCIGMERNELIHPHVEIIPNEDYDMLLLFTDGVTDCLSDKDIAVACRTTDKHKLATRIVESALKHDSVLPEEYQDYTHLNGYLPGGKDNATVATIINEDLPEERE